MAFTFIVSYLAIAAVSAVVSAQLSSNCTSALTAVAAHPDASACLSVAALAPIIFGPRNTSIVPSINSWLSSFCPAQPCANRTLAAIAKNITTGCTSDLSLTAGSTNDISSTIIPLVQQYYPAVRKVLCLDDSGVKCVIQTLTNIENAIGPINISGIIPLVLNPNPHQISANITCTNCIKAAYNIINHDIPALVSDAAPSLQSQCGASFIDGNTPPGISQTAAEPATNATSSAPALTLPSIIHFGTVLCLVISMVTLFPFLT